MPQHATVSISESLCVLLREAQAHLPKQASYDGGPVADFVEIRRMLEALPLATAEFGLAINRVTNAQHYLHCSEYGAARYELRLLLKSLEQ